MGRKWSTLEEWMERRCGLNCSVFRNSAASAFYAHSAELNDLSKCTSKKDCSSLTALSTLVSMKRNVKEPTLHQILNVFHRERCLSVCLSDTLGNKLAFGDTEDGNHGGLWFSLYFTFYVKRQFLITLVEISISSFKFVEKTEMQVFKSSL